MPGPHEGYSGGPIGRLKVVLAVSFLVTWTCWWTLALLARAHTIVYGQLPFVILYGLGGLGPTIAAYAAVVATPSQASLGEFHARLFRWRIPLLWFTVALALPVAISLASLGIAIAVHADTSMALSVRPWYSFFPLLCAMVVGGGLEELGWRGVAQPEMERLLTRPIAAALVGVIWSFWHLPLFAIPGVGQYGSNFAVFALSCAGMSLVLAWLYGHTESILLCVLAHASWNAVSAMGLASPSGHHQLSVLDACLKVVVGVLLLAGFPAPRDGRS